MQGFDLDELFLKFRYPLLILLIGGICVAGGIFFFKAAGPEGLWPGGRGTKVEILGTSTQNPAAGNITVEISGAIQTPGVYKLSSDARIDDLLIIAGGFTANADRAWTEKYLNRAAKLTDGQKVYIPTTNEQSGTTSAKTNGGNQTTSSLNSSDSTSLININTASLTELDSLPGIGQVYGQNIIEHRPYSNTTELVSKGAIKQSLYDKIKDLVSVY